MLCEKCKKNTATVCVTTIINGDKTVKNLCPACAEQEGHLNMGFDFDHDFSWQNLWPKVFSLGQSDMMQRLDDLVCSQCHLSLQDFTKQGRLGCSHCYTDFARQLEPIIKQMHVGEQHTGKMPKRLSGVKGIQREIDGLKGQLQQAIQVENFELAAKLRDEIKGLQQKAEKGAQANE